MSASPPSTARVLLRAFLTGVLVFTAASLLTEAEVKQAPTKSATFYGDF